MKQETVNLLNFHKSIVARLRNTLQNKKLAVYHHQDAHCSQELTIRKYKIIRKRINKSHPHRRFPLIQNLYQSIKTRM